MTVPTTERVRAFLARPGITKQLLADAAKVHRNSIRDEDESWEPSRRVAAALADAIDRLERAIA